MENRQILKVTVGSQAHGLATPESDFDYRGVFIVPTSEILKLGGSPKTTHWIEGNDDDTSWELGHFLNLAIHCNPTILETFLAPMVYSDLKSGDLVKDIYDNDTANRYAYELRDLFSFIWNSKDVCNAFVGYGVNQRKKMLEDKDARPHKYAAAYLRVLYNAYELLTTSTFTIRIIDTPVGETVKRFKEGNFQKGEVIDVCEHWQKEVEKIAKENPRDADLEPVNEFLLKVRKENW